jgi:hypothetical protein
VLAEKDAQIEQEIRAVVGVDRCQTKVHSKYVETGEDAEDGMPAYYANCIVISRIVGQQTAPRV